MMNAKFAVDTDWGILDLQCMTYIEFVLYGESTWIFIRDAYRKFSVSQGEVKKSEPCNGWDPAGSGTVLLSREYLVY
jgi:hypothetical protein